jgi:hypothetical protein
MNENDTRNALASSNATLFRVTGMLGEACKERDALRAFHVKCEEAIAGDLDNLFDVVSGALRETERWR